MKKYDSAEKALWAHNKRMSEIPNYSKPKSIPEGLKNLADWFDALYENDPDTAVQEDLRRWAKSIESIAVICVEGVEFMSRTEMAEKILAELREAE